MKLRAGSSVTKDGATLAVFLASSNVLEWARVVTCRSMGQPDSIFISEKRLNRLIQSIITYGFVQ